MPSKAEPKAAKRPSHVKAAGKGERSRATKNKSRPAAAKPALLAGGNP